MSAKLLALVGQVLVIVFLGYLAFKLGDIPLIVVCAIGAACALYAFIQDEVKASNGG